MGATELNDIIAERQFHVVNRPGQKITLVIGRPRPLEEGGDWTCPYQFVGVGDEVVRHCTGVDGLQAIQLVISSAAPAWLALFLRDQPSLRWEDADSGDFGPGIESVEPNRSSWRHTGERRQ